VASVGFDEGPGIGLERPGASPPPVDRPAGSRAGGPPVASRCG